MDKLIIGGITLSVVLMWLTGNVTWILVSINLLWMFFKGGALFAWWIPITTGVLFIVLLAAFISFTLWAKS